MDNCIRTLEHNYITDVRELWIGRVSRHRPEYHPSISTALICFRDGERFPSPGLPWCPVVLVQKSFEATNMEHI